MRSPCVVDTNVPVVANGKTPQASENCVAACIRELVTLRKNGKVLLDESGFILQEYRRHLSPRGQPGMGDEFFKWLWDNQGNERYCLKVSVTPNDDDGYDFSEFPTDFELDNFDRSDRKFVAVALAYGGMVHILNASDTDWWIYREALESYGIAIRFLCPELMVADRSY